jgi:beta-1,2-mannobiose phosphorylase / 1,2-beta-oligomannan phosphorylase
MTRRELLVLSAATVLNHTILRGDLNFHSADQLSWHKYAGNPVLGGKYGSCFDVCVLRDHDRFRMWLSWRPHKSIAISESGDGIHWSAPEIVLSPNSSSGWEDEVNRPVVVIREDGYHMWYTGQAGGKSRIGYARSANGRDWSRQSVKPVLQPDQQWEGVAVMCPHVMCDEHDRIWKLWYSAGQQYEPNAIGYATSKDGLHWDKFPANPVLTPAPNADWEKDRVTAAQVLLWNDYYYAFYIGFRDINHAQIGLARSKDGITNWERSPGNPIVRPTPGGWDADACYKPYALFTDGRWMLWYNGRNDDLEQIGLVTHSGTDLWAPY